MVTWLRYARHEDVAACEAEGWALLPINLGPGHGRYSVLMQWAGEGDPPAEPIPISNAVAREFVDMGEAA